MGTETVVRQLTKLRQEHRELDQTIASMEGSASVNHLEMRRLKKRKLQLKDMIARLESRLIPDLNA